MLIPKLRRYVCAVYFCFAGGLGVYTNLQASDGTMPVETSPVPPIRFKLDAPGQVSLGIYDQADVKVRDLLAGKALAAGEHEVAFDGLNEDGRALSPGDYEWRMVAHEGIRAEYVTSLGTSWKDLHWPAQHGGPKAVSYRDGLVWISASPEGSPQTVCVREDGSEYIWASNVFFGWGHPLDTSVDMSLSEPTHWVLVGHMQNHSRTIWRENALTGERPPGGEHTNLELTVPLRDIGHVGDAPDATAKPITSPYEPGLGYGWLEPEEPEQPPTKLKIDLPEGHCQVTLHLSDVPNTDMHTRRIGFLVNGKWRRALAAVDAPRRNVPVPLNVQGPEAVLTIYSPDGPSNWTLDGIRIEATPSRIDARDGRLAVLFNAANQILWYDAESMEKIGTADIGPGAYDLSLAESGHAIVAAGDQLRIVGLDDARPRTFARGLTEAKRVAVDRRTGKVFTAERGDVQQVKRFSAQGRLEKAFGRKGGRRTGRYVAEDFLAVADVNGTGDGGFVIVEADSAPRRTALFDDDGQLRREWYGGQRFYTFGEPDPQDATRFWLMSQWGWVMEIEIDYKTGDWRPLATYQWKKMLDRSMVSAFENASRYHIIRRDVDGDGKTERFIWVNTLTGLLLRVDEEAGVLRPFAALATVPGNIVGPKLWKDPLPASELPPLYIAALAKLGIDVDETPIARQQWKTYSWADANGDGTMQADEITLHQMKDYRLLSPIKGAMEIDDDFNIYTSWGYGGVDRPAWVKFPATGYTDIGAPQWSWNEFQMPDNTQPFVETRDLHTDEQGVVYTASAGGGDSFGDGGVGGGGHGFGWPATLAKGTAVSAYAPDGTLLWRSARQASQREARSSRMHFPVYIAGVTDGIVGVSDYAVQPCEFFTRDGLYLGGLLDGRVDDGLPERVYTWWTTNPQRPAYERQGLLQYDMVIGGTFFEHAGALYYAGAGWNNMPLYRVHGVDAVQNRKGTLSVSDEARIVPARAQGKGLQATLYASGKPKARWVTGQIWYQGMEKWPEDARGDGKKVVRFTGQIEGRFDQDYVLAVYGRGRVRLRVGGRVLMDRHIKGKFFTDPVRLRPHGPVQIQLDYEPDPSGVRLHLSWESHNQPIQHVPAELLYTPDQASATSTEIELSVRANELARGQSTTILLRRTGSRDSSLEVPVRMEGNAKEGVDVRIEPAIAQFDPGREESRHTIYALRSDQPQPRKSLKLYPQVSSHYTIKPATGVTVSIQDPDTQRIHPVHVIDATGKNAEALFDASGLSQQGDQRIHGEDHETMWFSKVPGRELPEQYITVDLGRVHRLTDIELWNFNRPGYRHGGVGQLEIEVSIDSPDDFRRLSDPLHFDPAPEDDPCVAQHRPLDFTARYVRFRPQIGHGSGLGFGLSEIILYGVPLP